MCRRCCSCCLLALLLLVILVIGLIFAFPMERRAPAAWMFPEVPTVFLLSYRHTSKDTSSTYIYDTPPNPSL
jgi:hypothetical protein